MTRFSAFISYSHADSAVARWLHHSLETFRIPRALVGTPSPFGDIPHRLPPVFRDRDELPASGDLGEELRSALADSRFQVVICSPQSARSKWVNEEILSFKRVHGEGRTLALIASGEPYAGGDLECFPPGLRFRLAADGTLSDVRAEPIAADIRPGKDGRRLALLKIIAGLTGLKLDALARRDAARRQRRLAIVTGLSLGVAVLTIGLAIYADGQRRVAESQRRLADKSLEFLIGTFAIANPATENPKTITALTILDRVSKRASSELAREPAVGAKLLATTGEIYFNLGLPKESERDLRAALALEPAQSEGRALALLKLSTLAYKRGDPKQSLDFIAQANQAYDHDAAYAPSLAAKVAERRAMVDYVAGRYAEAAKRLDGAANLFRALPGDHRSELGGVLMNEAQALVRVRRFAEADRLFAAASALYAAKFGTNHVLTATSIQNRAWADFENGRFAEADAGIGRAVAIYRTVLDDDHPSVAASLILTGRIRTARGDFVGALAALDKARSIYTRLYGPTNSAVGDVDFYAAEASSARGDTDRALRYVSVTKLIYDASYGPKDPDQVELLMLRSRIFARANRPDDARRDCETALKLQILLDPNDDGIIGTRRICAAIGTRRIY
ncbi:tetratricopeptide repeat protein [Sphingosinicellaceae bacterium]|nr:tetratricopeptide repeat protein [Sphingosinicellaceae bacterium]